MLLRQFTYRASNIGRAPVVRARRPYGSTCPEPEWDTGCTYCMPDMEKFPEPKKKFPIMPFHSKQLIISTGTSDWPSKIGVPGSLAGELEPLKRSLIKQPVLITNSNLAAESDNSKSSAYLFPDGLYFPEIRLDQITGFASRYLNDEKDSECSDLKVIETQSPMILVCGHGSRDERCGIIAPMLVKEFEKTLEHYGRLYDKDTNPTGVQVAICSHIGGHAFAGNIIYHDGKGSRPVWYAKVFPPQVQGIVRETIIKGETIDELHRK